MTSPLSADADAAERCALVAYQVIGALAHYASLFEHQEVQRVLDFFSGNGPWTEEFLPWPKVQLRHTPAATTDFKALAVEFEKLFEAWLHTPASYPLVNPRGDLEQFLWDNKAGLLAVLKSSATQPPAATTAVAAPGEGDREFYERNYHGHGQGLVITQPESGKFIERPMTPAELAARKPALWIAEHIHKMACYAAFAYIMAWEQIAPAIDKALAAYPATPPSAATTAADEALERAAVVAEEYGTWLFKEAIRSCTAMLWARGDACHHAASKIRALKSSPQSAPTNKDKE